MRHIVKTYVERQLESLTHYTRNEIDSNSIIPSIPSARDKVILRSILREPDSNLRNPIIFVVLPSQKIIPFSADLNFNAQDNKMTESLTPRTGSFCTAYKLSTKDLMNEDLMSQPLYMDLGTDELNMTFKMLAEKLNIAEDEIDTCELPAKPGDYSSRFGIKRAPMTDKFEITKIVSVLHAAKL